MFSDRNKVRSKFTGEQYEKAEVAYRERIAMIHHLQDMMDNIGQNKKLQSLLKRTEDGILGNRFYRAIIHMYPEYQDFDITISNMPLHKVVEDVAGPIHRLYNVDWKMEVQPSGDVLLRTNVQPNEYTNKWVTINITATKGLPKCKIVEIDKGYTRYPKKEYKIVCS